MELGKQKKNSWEWDKIAGWTRGRKAVKSDIPSTVKSHLAKQADSSAQDNRFLQTGNR